MQKDYILKTDADFDNAILFQLPVIVWQNGEILDYGGVIQEHTSKTVRINDDWYVKCVCEFRIR